MKRIILGAVFAFTSSAAALAADLPAGSWSMAPALSPAHNWSGFYAGLNAGGAFGTSNLSTNFVDINGTPRSAFQPPVVATDSRALTSSGFTGGGQIGYNYQSGQWVFGIEQSFEYFGLRGSRTDTGSEGGVASFSILKSVKTDWLLTVRPRVGYAFNNTLIYATGGLAATEVTSVYQFSDTLGATGVVNSSKAKAGWTVGAGAEQALAANWSVKLEYLYADFGSVSASAPFVNNQIVNGGLGLSLGQLTHGVDLKSNIVRVGVNHYF
jgi:outer membrane immunogenic protein